MTYIRLAEALAAIEALKYGDIDHDAETFHHDDGLNNALAAINALPASDVASEVNALKDALAQAEGIIADLRAGIQA